MWCNCSTRHRGWVNAGFPPRFCQLWRTSAPQSAESVHCASMGRQIGTLRLRHRPSRGSSFYHQIKVRSAGSHLRDSDTRQCCTGQQAMSGEQWTCHWCRGVCLWVRTCWPRPRGAACRRAAWLVPVESQRAVPRSAGQSHSSSLGAGPEPHQWW